MIRQAAKCQRDRLDVGINIRVVELNIVDDRNVRQVLEELGRLVEERAVVLVPFDDEVASLSHAIAGSLVAKIARDAADEHTRIRARIGQHPPGQRGCCGLPVRACDDDRPRAPEKMLAYGFRQRTVANLPIENFLELRVAA